MAYDRIEPYNDLPSLPPQQAITDDIEILKKLVITSRALADVNSTVKRLPNPLMLINTIALQEAKASTAIENIFTTEDELYKAVSDTLEEDNIRPGTKEVLRYREALWQGYNLLKNKDSIDLESIIEVFRKIKNSTASLRSPQSLTTIKRGQSEFRAGDVVYTPPRGTGVVEKMMENLLEYLNNDEEFPTDPLIKMCIAHYQFEAIHPFSDGNGRTGRVINLLYLVKKGLLDQPVLYLSKYIIVNKDEYYYHLGTVTQRGSWKNWIMYMLEAIEKTAQLTSQLITSILSQMEATLDHARNTISWYSKEVNELLFSQPYIRPALLGKMLGITSRTTLTKYFNDLVDAKILSRSKDGRSVFYINDDLIRILEG